MAEGDTRLQQEVVAAADTGKLVLARIAEVEEVVAPEADSQPLQ